jgi:hypothetical protein
MCRVYGLIALERRVGEQLEARAEPEASPTATARHSEEQVQ